ncbi:hypothetical protein CRG98_042711, partial [Punica granatum]
MEISSKIPPVRMFKAFVLDADAVIPKILPQAIKSVEVLEGDGGAGTIKLITLGEVCKNTSKYYTVGEVTIMEDQIKAGKEKASAMMGVTSFTQEFPCPISPALMFRALIVESSALIPRLLPQLIKSVELVEGDGGAGSIEQVNFTE